ncbi:unnamed protein product [Kuraishia capsulata CBS 1993]|uniref:Transcription elongation factor Eaf N-terminal domain-containing protein n=1 Tax=Kuraishia capsulata CBS 1993 TaxID=1382522 RepID=W6MGU4_9ASCO|nr:uncharacterized protein KUCA_T00001379001 [Kuraishia capsulata CBS 1993]CDK25409.1 unnamed protein product [Kuraishia capsulata CBS 1993]
MSSSVMIPDGEYEIDISSLLFAQRIENFGIRYGFRPDSIDQSMPLDLVKDTLDDPINSFKGEGSYILRAHVDSKHSKNNGKYVFFDGVLGSAHKGTPHSSTPNSPAIGGSTATPSTEFLLLYDNNAKDFKLEPSGGVLKMNKSRNPEKLSKKFSKLKTQAKSRMGVSTPSLSTQFELKTSPSRTKKLKSSSMMETSDVNAKTKTNHHKTSAGEAPPMSEISDIEETGLAKSKKQKSQQQATKEANSMTPLLGASLSPEGSNGHVKEDNESSGKAEPEHQDRATVKLISQVMEGSSPSSQDNQDKIQPLESSNAFFDEDDWDENLDDWEDAFLPDGNTDSEFAIVVDETPLLQNQANSRSRRGSASSRRSSMPKATKPTSMKALNEAAEVKIARRTRRRTSEIKQREEVRDMLTPELNGKATNSEEEDDDEDFNFDDDFDKAIDSFEEEEKKKGTNGGANGSEDESEEE